MTKISYTLSKNFRKDTLLLLEKIVVMVDDYEKKGYRMTLRQLFYQLVSHDMLPNDQKKYKKLSTIIKDARMAGLIDWDVIEDRIRIPTMPSEFENISHLVKAAISSYRRDRWENQEYYVEVWVEKDALSGVLEPVTRKYHVHLLVNRGYSSTSALHESVLRIKQQQDKECIILYLGDHDPSGKNMITDIKNRLEQFQCDATVRDVALTMEQIKQYNLPPNSAKKSDPRSDKYIKRHGNLSWELDALTPEVLNQLVSSHIEEFLDMDEYQRIINQEEEEKMELVQVTQDI
ncbi:MAG: hypothetical protein OES15_00760 [Nitrosopumilus sp.]|nr:hypothetical protein [Nitrosopumilus sp.]MDH3852817.1 hypothetical protein [Nitrosopumilus sp.]